MATPEFRAGVRPAAGRGGRGADGGRLLGDAVVALPPAADRRRGRPARRRGGRPPRRRRAASRTGRPRACVGPASGSSTTRGRVELPPMIPLEGPEAAKAAGLRYTTDTLPGIKRVKRGKSFAYLAADGKPIADKNEIARIKSLAIPPAYSDVWICPLANGHLQATGRDARGRKQYRYHQRWRAVRDETKFDRMVAFAKALPTIRAAVAARHAQARAAAREGAGDRGLAARGDGDPRRQRGVRARERLLRPHHAAGRARRGQGRDDQVPLPRQERQGPRRRGPRQAAGADRQGQPGLARRAPLRVRRRRRHAAPGALRGRQRLPPGDRPATTSRPRTSARGRPP